MPYVPKFPVLSRTLQRYNIADMLTSTFAVYLTLKYTDYGWWVLWPIALNTLMVWHLVTRYRALRREDRILAGQSNAS